VQILLLDDCHMYVFEIVNLESVSLKMFMNFTFILLKRVTWFDKAPLMVGSREGMDPS
jgi:hypothetical protein